MAVQSLVVRLSAQVGNYVSGLRQAQQATEELGQSQQQIPQQSHNLDDLGNKAGIAGLAIAAGVGLAIKTYADFDQAMSGVRAQLGGTGADMGKLEDAIRKAGASTVFSSTEAAEAAEELAKAGLSANDIMGGALTGALSLASAGSLDLADAAEYSANAMQTFGLKASDVGHIADVLANGALMSTASVKSLSQGMSQAGLVANSMGLSLEDTVGTLSAFDQAGLKGSDAGTSLKTMLTALANPSEKASRTMEQLGINVYDAQGNFIGMEGLAGQLKNQLGGLTQQQRNAALATIFGSDAIRAANVLYNEGASGIKGWIDGVNKSGTAALIAAQKQNNWKGDLEKLQGALQDFFIGAGSGADGPLRKLTQWATNFLGVLGKLPDGVKSTGLLLAALGGAALLGVAGVIKVGKAFRDTRRDIAAGRAALRLWSTQAGGTGSLLSGLGARVRTLGTRFRSLGTATKIGIGVGITAILALGAAMTQTGDAQENFGRSNAKVTDDLVKLATNGKGLDNVFSDLQIAMGSDESLSFADGLSVATSKAGGLGSAIGKVATGFGTFGTGASSAADAVKARMKSLGESLAGLVEDGHADVAARAFAQIQSEANKAGISTAQLNKLMPAYANALQDQSNKQKLAADSGKKNADAIAKQKQEAKDAVDAIKNLGNALLEQRGDARGFQAAMDDATSALKKNGRTLDITTEKGRANQEALDGIASSSSKWAAQVLQDTGSQKQANAVLETGRAQYIKMATAMGMSKTAAKELADKLFDLPAGTDTSVKVDGIDGAIYKVDQLGNLVVSVSGKKISIPAETPNAGQVAEVLYSIQKAVLATDGKSVKIPTAAIDSPETLRNLQGIRGARLNADGSVSIPTSALNAKSTTALLGNLGRVAVDADGKSVIIPASTPNAPKVISLINQIHGAQIATNGKKVTISTSAPLAADTRAKIDSIKGAQVSTNGRKVTINTSAPGARDAYNQITSVLRAAQSKSITISITRAFKTVGDVFPTGGSLFAKGGITDHGVQKMARGDMKRPAMMSNKPILWGEAGLELYAPLAKDSRAPRAISLIGAGADFYGYDLVKRATGAIDGMRAGWDRAQPVQSSRTIIQSSTARFSPEAEGLIRGLAQAVLASSGREIVVQVDGKEIARANASGVRSERGNAW